MGEQTLPLRGGRSGKNEDFILIQGSGEGVGLHWHAGGMRELLIRPFVY